VPTAGSPMPVYDFKACSSGVGSLSSAQLKDLAAISNGAVTKFSGKVHRHILPLITLFADSLAEKAVVHEHRIGVMSAFGPKQTCQPHRRMSALGVKADMADAGTAALASQCSGTFRFGEHPVRIYSL
jgi:hypothetical protein